MCVCVSRVWVCVLRVLVSLSLFTVSYVLYDFLVCDCFGLVVVHCFGRHLPVTHWTSFG